MTKQEFFGFQYLLIQLHWMQKYRRKEYDEFISNLYWICA